MQDWLKQAAAANKGVVNFGALPEQSWTNTMGSGVAYLAATAGAQTYSANALTGKTL